MFRFYWTHFLSISETSVCTYVQFFMSFHLMAQYDFSSKLFSIRRYSYYINFTDLWDEAHVLQILWYIQGIVEIFRAVMSFCTYTTWVIQKQRQWFHHEMWPFFMHPEKKTINKCAIKINNALKANSKLLIF